MKKLALLVVCAFALTAAALRGVTHAPQDGDWWSRRHAEKMKFVQAGTVLPVFREVVGK